MKERRILMCLAFTALASVANAYITPDAPSPKPISITVHFGRSAEATFNLEQARTTSIDFLVGGNIYRAILVGCTPVTHVHFDTALLIQGRPRTQEGDFMLTFRMGEEAEKRFGELPLVQISFKGGKLSKMLYYRKTSQQAGFSAQLCPGTLLGR